MINVVSEENLPVGTESDVVTVRTRVYELAVAVGFDTFTTAALTTATSELTRNIWVHAKKGYVRVQRVTEGPRQGFRIYFVDQGPGITDVQRVLSGGFSTAKSLGLGLYGSRRLVDDFDIETLPGRGTTITIVKWARDTRPKAR